MDKFSMSYIFSFSRYQTKFLIKLLFKQFDLFYILPLGIKNALLELAGKKLCSCTGTTALMQLNHSIKKRP